MTIRQRFALAIAVVGCSGAAFAEGPPLASHRALYNLSLSAAKPSSGIIGASGTLGFELVETCDGWTAEQRYRLHLVYQENPAIDIGAALVTWESRDGTKYRFNQRKTRNGQIEEELDGTATLGPNGGKAVFDKPSEKTFDLPAGTVFSNHHSEMLLQAALDGTHFLTAKVFDGTSVDGPSLVTATIDQARDGKATAASAGMGDVPLLSRPSWTVRLGFYTLSTPQETPDYNLTMRMLDNGVGGGMTLDYGDYALTGTISRIEAVKRPKC